MTGPDTYLLLRAFVDELGRCGMADACTSPGSRSTPLVLSLAREPGLPTLSHIDERCAGFFALGLAKASGRPVALACTSGTAAANYLPAVIEAHEARVPLIVLTADRPPELREVGAGQTIDQLKLYGDAAKWFFEVGTHERRPSGCAGCARSPAARSGPPRPGAPGPCTSTSRCASRSCSTSRCRRPTTGARRRRAPPRRRRRAAIDAGGGERAVVVAGRHERDDGPPRRCRPPPPPLGAARCWPTRCPAPAAVPRPSPTTTRCCATAVRRRPSPRARAARRRPADLQAAARLARRPRRRAQVVIDPEAAWQDPAAVVGDLLAADPAALRRGRSPDRRGRAAWLDAWRAPTTPRRRDRRDPGRRAQSRVARASSARPAGEATARRRVLDADPRRRDVLPGRDDAPRVLANRGANGIDGTISTAFGVAAARRARRRAARRRRARARPRRLLIAAAGPRADDRADRQRRRRHLPLPARRAQTDAFEEHVATPHGPGLRRLAALYGVRYERVRRPRRSPRGHEDPPLPSAPTARRTSSCTAAWTVRPVRPLASFERQSQTTLLPARTAPACPRARLEVHRPGDIVEIDKKGRRFHALVTELVQRETGRFELTSARWTRGSPTARPRSARSSRSGAAQGARRAGPRRSGSRPGGPGRP